MILGMLLPDTIVVFAQEGEPSGTSIFGDPEYDEAAGVAIPAHLEPLDATEDEVNRDVRLNRYRVTTELAASLDGLAEVEWRGRRYSVQGEPKLLSSYRGPHHYEFEIRGVEG